jgi:hypothetical protein
MFSCDVRLIWEAAGLDVCFCCRLCSIRGTIGFSGAPLRAVRPSRFRPLCLCVAFAGCGCVDSCVAMWESDKVDGWCLRETRRRSRGRKRSALRFSPRTRRAEGLPMYSLPVSCITPRPADTLPKTLSPAPCGYGEVGSASSPCGKDGFNPLIATNSEQMLRVFFGKGHLGT